MLRYSKGPGAVAPSARCDQHALPGVLNALTKIYYLLTPAERREGGVLLVLMLFGMGLETLSVGLVIPVIAVLMQDDLVARFPAFSDVIGWLGRPTQETLAVVVMLLLVVVYLFKAIFLAFLVWYQTRFAFGVQAQLSQRLFTTYLRQPYTFHLQRNSAELIRNAITEVGAFTGSVMIAGMLLLTEGFVLFGIAALMFTIEPVGASLVILVLGVAMLAFHYGTRTRVACWGESRQHHEGLRLQHLQQGLGAAKDVTLLGREQEFFARYALHNSQSARMAQLQTALQQLPRLWLELLAVIGLATLVLSMLSQGRQLGSIVPILGLFAAAAFRLMPSVTRILAAMQSLRFGLPVIKVLHDELQLPTPAHAVRTTDGATTLRHEIRLINVHYTYPGGASSAITNISLAIQRGECIGFVGPSGSGKSTLVDLILGLLTPDDGRVAADGQDIQANLRAWQNQIGYVPQFIYLTDDTLRNNVAFGLPDEQIDDAAVQRAIKAAQLEEFIADLPQGLETVVGERGVRLSGGQRQRIGIARALYHDPGILVLDEATSALDVDTERGMMAAVLRLQGNKTILIVTHRLSAVEHCDRLFRLEQGRVVGEQRGSSLQDANRFLGGS